jgi:hypothetical protein
MSKMIQNHVEEECPSIEKLFSTFIWRRMEALDNVPDSEEKENAQAAIREAYQKLKAILKPEEYKEIILEVLDPCAGTVESCGMEAAYRLGLKDGMAFSAIFNR